jgi:hypothetical protein
MKFVIKLSVIILSVIILFLIKQFLFRINDDYVASFSNTEFGHIGLTLMFNQPTSDVLIRPQQGILKGEVSLYR